MEQLIEYIKAQEKKGYTQQYIAHFLIRNGYNPDVVMHALNVINAQRHEDVKIVIGAKDILHNPVIIFTLLKDLAVFIANAVKGLYRKVRSTHSGRQLIVVFSAVAVLLMIVFGVLWFINLPRCGNGKLEDGESSSTCCLDAGCAGEQECTPDGCKDPVCGTCQFLQNHRCMDYECCTDNHCTETEECVDHSCVEIRCSTCQYILNRKCRNYTCCSDSQCDDGRDTTDDVCVNPATLESMCDYRSKRPCRKDSDCDDNNPNTKDTCRGLPMTCFNELVTECENGDGLCPDGCRYEIDTDCEKCGNGVIGKDEQCDFKEDTDFCIGCRYNLDYDLGINTSPGQVMSVEWYLGKNATEISLDFDLAAFDQRHDYRLYLFEGKIGERYSAVFLRKGEVVFAAKDTPAEMIEYPDMLFNESMLGSITKFNLKQGKYVLRIERQEANDEVWYACELTYKQDNSHYWCGSIYTDELIREDVRLRFIFDGQKWTSQKLKDIPSWRIEGLSLGYNKKGKMPENASSSYEDPRYGDHIPMENIYFNRTSDLITFEFGPEVIRRRPGGRLYR